MSDFFDKHPKLHAILLILIFPGLVFAWFLFIVTFEIYDSFVEEFDPYFRQVKSRWGEK